MQAQASAVKLRDFDFLSCFGVADQDYDVFHTYFERVMMSSSLAVIEQTDLSLYLSALVKQSQAISSSRYLY